MILSDNKSADNTWTLIGLGLIPSLEVFMSYMSSDIFLSEYVIGIAAWICTDFVLGELISLKSLILSFGEWSLEFRFEIGFLASWTSDSY